MLQEADMGVTQMAMGSNQNAGDETLLVKFFMKATLDGKKTETEGRPIFKEVPHIQIMQPGNKDSIILRPARQMDFDRFPEHYRKFQTRTDDEEYIEGTLLEAWPGVTRAQVEELRFFNVRTVEQLASMTDTNSQGLMGINMLKRKAKAYLEEADGNAAKQALAEQKAKNEDLEAKIAALTARLGELENETPKPKRKRRTKAQIEADKE
jgi:hypothetical protein